MKVICINGNHINNPGVPNNTPVGLIEGEIYTVIEVMTHPIWKSTGYLLAEIKSDAYMGGFLAERFAPISEIDETEMIREYNKQLV